jgi:hypothetical protein
MSAHHLQFRKGFAAFALIVLSILQPVLLKASIWEKLSTATSPAARLYPAMAYDPVSQKIVLFGGLGNSGNLNDTWTFDGTNWTQVSTSVAPPVRNGATMAFDSRTRTLVMFGGFDVDQFLNDTWIWDGATSTWTEAVISNPPPKATGAMLFSDPVSGRAMMFGGYNANYPVPVLNGTWRWNGSYWQKLNPSTVPYPKAWATATLDPIRKNVVLTGGTGDTIRADNTWTWDGSNWTMQAPATQVPAYIGEGSAFDPLESTVVLFGVMAQTWSWTGSDWVELTPVNSPTSRSGVGMAYDPDSRQTILFGGSLDNGSLANTTWKFAGK